jgi:hypothetical protein
MDFTGNRPGTLFVDASLDRLTTTVYVTVTIL